VLSGPIGDQGMTWTSEQQARLRETLTVDPRHPWTRRRFPASPHGVTPDGLADFRHLPFSGATTIDILDVDFTGATSLPNEHGVDTGLTFHSCRGRRVQFDGAGTFHRLDGIYDECSSDRIRAERCHVVGLFRRCSFRQAHLKRAMLASNFVRCIFDAAQLDVGSWASSFEECRFVDCRISPVFSEIAEFVESGDPVTFSVLNSGRVRPGETASYFTRQELLRGWSEAAG
jgi:hypothetical protein